MKKLRRKIKDLIRDSSRFFLSQEQYIRSRFYLTHGYKLNLKNPKTWNEKIQWRKLYGDHKKYSEYVDKYLVREKIKEILGEEYLIPLIGKYNKITMEDLEKLPREFVIKTSNGGGGENVKIIRDKSKIDGVQLCKEFNKYLRVKVGERVDELYYDLNDGVIIVEKLILDSRGKIPRDYKFHCFRNNKDIEMIIQVDVGRFEKHYRNFYDKNWEKIDLMIAKKNTKERIEKPKNFEILTELVKRIAENFDYVRVDMYNVEGKIYFGEITFAHGSGYERLSYEWDLKMGKLWEWCEE